MTLVKGLKAPENLIINFAPSEKQYELWQLLQPNRCNLCGGEIEQKAIGRNEFGTMEYKATCVKCGNQNLPQLILAGGAAGGGKTYLSSCWIISSCLRFPGLRAVIARKTLKSLKESVLNTIKKVLREWGLEEGVNYRINNLEAYIQFYNSSVILMKELCYQPSDDSYSRLGSSEYSIAAVEECNECPEKGVEVLMSRLRWMPEAFKVPKLLLTCNPCLNWPRSRFVQDDDGNPVVTADGEFYCPFTLDANPDLEFRKAYSASMARIKDPAVYRRLRYGDWNIVDSNELAAYQHFDGRKHLIDNLRERVYNPMKPIILSFDFNVAPYMSCLAFQINHEQKKVYVLEEILGYPENKENNTPKLAKKIRKKYLAMQHTGGIIVTGDPAGLARSTQTEEGVNNFSILMSNLDCPSFHTKKRLLPKQPSQVARLDFINALFSGYEGWEILIDMRCRRFTEDLIYQKKNSDGTKSKAKVTDPKLGVKYEKYGHLSDCFDMFCCLFLGESWKKFNTGGDSGITTYNGTPIYGSFEY